jgi:hypothetical protein
MHFPNSGSGRPYVRIDGRSGSFALSVPDGDPEIVEMHDKKLDLDIAGAEQGWLRLSKDGADWQPLATLDDWAGTPKPSADHNAGVCIDVMCADWPEPKVRELRGSSRAITGWIARIALAAGDVPEGKAIRIRVTGAKVLTFGKGSSVDIGFEIAPRDKWPDVAAFDEHRRDDAPTDGASGASKAFGDMKDSPLGGPAKAAADAWA